MLDRNQTRYEHDNIQQQAGYQRPEAATHVQQRRHEQFVDTSERKQYAPHASSSVSRRFDIDHFDETSCGSASLQQSSTAVATDQPTLFILDDDARLQTQVERVAHDIGFSRSPYRDIETWIDSIRDRGDGCLVADFGGASLSSLKLQEELNASGVSVPLIFLSHNVTVPLAVHALQNGAVTVLEKPCHESQLTAALETAKKTIEKNRRVAERKLELRQRLVQLTASECHVLEMIVAGTMNKVIARRLQVSLRTVESRRQAIFQKMKARSVAELVRLAIESGLHR